MGFFHSIYCKTLPSIRCTEVSSLGILCLQPWVFSSFNSGDPKRCALYQKTTESFYWPYVFIFPRELGKCQDTFQWMYSTVCLSLQYSFRELLTKCLPTSMHGVVQQPLCFGIFLLSLLFLCILPKMRTVFSTIFSQFSRKAFQRLTRLYLVEKKYSKLNETLKWNRQYLIQLLLPKTSPWNEVIKMQCGVGLSRLD